MDLIGTIGLKAIQTIVFVYDLITYPVYYLVQRPWKRLCESKIYRAYPVDGSKTTTEVTYRPIHKSTPKLDLFLKHNVRTMDECFNFAISLHGSRRCLGTRQLLDEEEELQPNGKIFLKWIMGDYRWLTYNETNDLAIAFGIGLRNFGMQPYQNIAIFAETRAEWLICAVACFKQSFPLVTIYANLGVNSLCFCIEQTESTHVITTQELLPKVKLALVRCKCIQRVIYIQNGVHPVDISCDYNVSFSSYDEVIKLGQDSSNFFVNNAPAPDDTAIIMYTSGSTGTPKGVVLSHESLVATVHAFHFVVHHPEPSDIYLGYLPLAHILELLSEITMLVVGVSVGYSSPNTMIDKSTKIRKGDRGDCTVLKPTCMCAVPLVIDRIYKGIHENINSKGKFMKNLLKFFYVYKSYYRQRGMRTPITDFLFFRNMRGIVGGNLRVLLSGGAPLSPEIHDYVENVLNVPLVQGYGLTETCACASIMDDTELSTGCVGPPLQGVLIKLVNWEEGNYKVTDLPCPRGEIIVGGRNVAKCYYKLPEKTAQDFFTDSTGIRWFRTGDIGQFEANGTLRVIDRKKDLVKLQSGEYVSLGKVEAEIKTMASIENICVYADSSQYYCVALILPNESKLTVLAAKLGLEKLKFTEMCINQQIVEVFRKEISIYGKNAGLEKFEIPTVITLVSDMWTPESGLVTAAFKLRRRQISEKYASSLKRMYQE